MNLLKSIAHVCIKSVDLSRTLDFYCGGLGLERQFDFTREGRLIGFYLKIADRSFIEVFEAEGIEAPKATSALHHFCLESDDLAAVRDRLIEHGFAPDEIRAGADASLQFWVNDPSGVRFECHQYTKESAQLGPAGAEVAVNW